MNITNQEQTGISTPLLVWSDSYRVGIAELDARNQSLIAMINELYDGMAHGKSPESLRKILDGITSFAINHFRAEEKYYQIYVYPRAIDHQKQHGDFKQELLSFRDNFKSSTQGKSLEALKFLSLWLKNHICEDDDQSCYFLRMKGLK